MKRLIVVRHGDFGNNFQLTTDGRKQIAALAKRLKPIVGKGTVQIITSPAERAKESAAILARALKTEFELAKALYWEGPRSGSINQAVDALLLQRKRVETIIVVTHLPLVEKLPVAFADAALGFTGTAGIRGYAKGWIVDVQKRILPI